MQYSTQKPDGNKPLQRSLTLAAIVLLHGPAYAESVDASHLITNWYHANGQCRGGASDAERRAAACAHRASWGQALARDGFCYGKRGEATYQFRWHTCTGSSLK